jgi:methyl-accepting chemotaxis protein
MLLGSAYYLVLRHVYQEQLLSQARTVADQVDAFGTWVSQYGRVWVKDNDVSYLGHIAVVPATPGDQPAQTTNFYSKNPALAQREFSEAVARSKTPAQFRMTSDNVMNPNNKPDAFEAEAIKIIRAQGLKEYVEYRDGKFRFARTLYHKESCIACHGAVASAPADVTTRYGSERGFGFKTGDVAGITSVTLPTTSLWESSLKVVGPIEIGLVILAFAIAFLFIEFGVVRPIKKLTQAADTLSTGADVSLRLQNVKENSRNELHQLAFSVSRMRTSLHILMERLKKPK